MFGFTTPKKWANRVANHKDYVPPVVWGEDAEKTAWRASGAPDLDHVFAVFQMWPSDVRAAQNLLGARRCLHRVRRQCLNALQRSVYERLKQNPHSVALQSLAAKLGMRVNYPVLYWARSRTRRQAQVGLSMAEVLTEAGF